MIDGSEKHKRQLAFELQNSRGFEKRSKLGIILNEQENNYWIRLSYDLKNYADLGGCYQTKPIDIRSSSISRILQIILSLFQ